ncbi:MAG: hypothetical protein AAFY02_21260 [Pseudomonadota bacterium]
MSGQLDEEQPQTSDAPVEAPAEVPVDEAESLLSDAVPPGGGEDVDPGDQLPPDNAFGTGGALKSDEEEKGKKTKAKRTRIIEIGWLVDGGGPGFLWDKPRPLKGLARPPEHPKAVNHCPAIVDGDARTYSVAAPVDFHLRLGSDEKGNPKLINAAGMKSTVSGGKLDRMITVMAQNRWRHPKRPVLQIVAPYRFICDEPCWMNQLPPYYDYKSPQWPGLMIGGRFPIHNWPRSLMWAFEWHDMGRDLIIKRGEPWFYVRFETLDPSRLQRLVEAEMTPELREFCGGLDGITNYVNQTFSVMDIAADRRPEMLLTRKVRGGRNTVPPAGPEVLSPHGDGN